MGGGVGGGGGHMSRGLAKSVAWAGFLPYAITEPSGIQTATAISTHVVLPPHAILPKTIVVMVAGMLVLGALSLAFREARLADGGRRRPATVAVLATMTGVFFILVLGWAVPSQ